MAKKRLTKAEIEYNKQVRRIKNFIRKATNRGYRFEGNVIPERPKRVTQASVNKLKKITPQKLYEKATALSEKLGKVITGLERRKEERKESAKKSAQTRRENLRRAEQNEKDFEKKKRKELEDSRKRMAQKPDIELFTEARQTMQTIRGLIVDIDRAHREASKRLNRLLDNEIATYGEEAVLRSIANSQGKALQTAEIVVMYGAGDSRHEQAIVTLEEIIRGTILSGKELKEISEAIDMEQDEDGDFYE